jgi:NAD(P)-dependent dehydrogenase (short-subunit alcohol dehydrogenase family)
VTVNALHPGVIRTDLGREAERGYFFNTGFSLIAPFVKSEAQGAKTSLHLALSPEVEGITGGYFKNEKPARTWSFASDDEAAARFWDYSNACIDAWKKGPPVTLPPSPLTPPSSPTSPTPSRS